MKKCLIRVDANETIGSGHVMRCLSIARAARDKGLECIFASAEESVFAIASKMGFDSISLKSNWEDLSEEIPALIQLVQDKNVTDILLDSYYVTPKYMQALRQVARLHYMDDLKMFEYPCDTLINYNASAPDMGYEEDYKNCKTQLLIGPTYAPLRPEFRDLPEFQCEREVEKVLITTGGSDPLNIAGQLVQCLKETERTSHLQLHVVSGSLNKNLPKLLRLQTENAGVVVCQDVQNMAELMCKCDVAITAGGSTMYELCACGVPSVFFTFADNQHAAIGPFADKLMLYAGDMRKNTIKDIVGCVLELLKSRDKRASFSKKMQLLADGYGADRIVDLIKYNLD